jgi:DNA repair exonuclease SbcCD nuclease subunit
MIGVVGDIHIKDELSYADYLPDRRNAERQDVFNKIIESLSDCDKVVLLGDSLNSKNNTSESIKIFVDFIKKLQVGNKKIYILAGNHEKFADGRTAIDFIKKLNDDNICVITNEWWLNDDGLVFVPYIYPSELKTNDTKKAKDLLMKELPEGNILFVHQAIENTKTDSGQMTDLFNEIVLDRKELEKRYKLIFGGHIHKPQRVGNTIVAGSVFTEEVNETEKYIWKIDELSYDVEQIKLPVRPIYKIENPNLTQVNGLEKNSIVKAVFTERTASFDEIVKELRSKDAHIIVEQYDVPRQKESETIDVTDLGIIDLLKIYAKQNSIDPTALIKAFDLVK